MKYYIGYYNKPWDKTEFTVICGTPREAVALFILGQYKSFGIIPETYEMLSVEEATNKKLIFN